MKVMIFNLLLAGSMMLSCSQEEGYTGFVNPDSGSEKIVLTTDKAAYKPGDPVHFSMNELPSGACSIRYRHLNEVVAEQPLTACEWTWTVPQEDFKGYMTEIVRMQNGSQSVLATIAVDVSSDWTRFPRYGFLSKFDKMPLGGIEACIDNLNRHHINGVQFQDWHYKHHWPLGGTPDHLLENYPDIANRNTSLTTLKNYISKIHSCGMKAIFYNLCFGALKDAAQDGVSEEWYLFKDTHRGQKDCLNLSAPFKSSIYLVDPSIRAWQEYIGKRNSDVYAVLDFDGYQIDQVGSRGDVYDYHGAKVNLPESYASFVRAMKEFHPEKRLVMNSVSEFGAGQIAGTGNVDFCYNEVWNEGDRFEDLKRIIDDNDSYSEGRLRTVFAAYMNYERANNRGTFNTPGVLLTNAVMFALGGAHLELGEHMLCKEYFPNNNLGMTEELKRNMVTYYDFLVAYENLLRDGGEFNQVEVTSTDGKMQIKPWAPSLGKVITVCREVDGRQVIHLLNFSQANSLSWRDMDGTMPEPEHIEAPELEVQTARKVKQVWVASPDFNHGAVQEVEFRAQEGKVSFSLPALKYWDMIVMEYE